MKHIPTILDSREENWDRRCGVVVFKKVRFEASTRKRYGIVFKKISTLESVFQKLCFGHRFHRLAVAVSATKELRCIRVAGSKSQEICSVRVFVLTVK